MKEKMIKVVTARDMLISIVICTHRSERYEDFVEAIDSLNAQSCDNEKLEIVGGCRWEQGAV